MTKALLVDDEPEAISALKFLIQVHCPTLEVIDTCLSVNDGISSIINNRPDLIFLDIEMPIRNGFELLEEIKQFPITIIFTTAHHQHAIKAIRYSALDYLLKPIDPKELVIAVNRFHIQKSIPDTRQVQFLIDQLQSKEHTTKKIAIPNMEGFKLISVDDIISCEADDNYTHIKLKKNIKITASRTLKEIQHLLEDYSYFLRIHNSYLVNIKEVSGYIKGEGGQVIMSDGSQLSVSRNKKETLLKYLTK